jgi:A/G-specific adenine glycosylase
MSIASHADRRATAFDARARRRLQTRLLNWFRKHQRPLPWRSTRDPYSIWVSEIMLQQTQVNAVVPFFQRFLAAFPNVQALANADEADVLRCWEGLGYYRRARNMHHAARLMVERHEGRFPQDPVQAQELPGIGRYTAGAILSQAFGQRLPILEANSRRVLCRLVGAREDPRRGPGLRRLWETAEELLPERDVGDFNQALMELGALVCTPTAPRCEDCPLRNECVARRHGLQEVIPLRDRAPRTIEVREVAAVVRRGARVLLVQRPQEGRWAGFWEFPHGPTNGNAAAAARNCLKELTGLTARIETPILTVRHSVTHHQITMVAYSASYRSGEFCSAFYERGRWLYPSQVANYPVSVPQRKLARAITP